MTRVDEGFGDRRVAGDLVNRCAVPTFLQKETSRRPEQVVMPTFGFLPGRPAPGTALERSRLKRRVGHDRFSLAAGGPK